MLANVIDTDQVNREHQTNSCHQFSISKLVKQNSRNQTGEKVDEHFRCLHLTFQQQPDESYIVTASFTLVLMSGIIVHA